MRALLILKYFSTSRTNSLGEAFRRAFMVRHFRFSHYTDTRGDTRAYSEYYQYRCLPVRLSCHTSRLNPKNYQESRPNAKVSRRHDIYCLGSIDVIGGDGILSTRYIEAFTRYTPRQINPGAREQYWAASTPPSVPAVLHYIRM
jgi:hypothetical protein